MCPTSQALLRKQSCSQFSHSLHWYRQRFIIKEKMYQMVHFVLPPCMIFSLYFFSLSISLSLLFSSPSFLSNPHPTLYLLRPHHLSHHVITKTDISLPPMRRSCFWSGRLVCLFVNTIPGKLLAWLSRNINFWSISESWGRCTNSFSLFQNKYRI